MIVAILSTLIVLLSIKAITDIQEGRKKKRLSYWFGDAWEKYD